MAELLKTWYGITAFIVFDVTALLLVICITYRNTTKYIFDWLIAVVCIAVLSPVYAVIFVRAFIEKQNGRLQRIFAHTKAVGFKGKPVCFSTFETCDEHGEMHAYGKWLTRTKLYTLSKFFDLFLGEASVIGVKALKESDCVFLTDEEEGRYAVKPGLINPLVLSGNKETNYDDMLESDQTYAKNIGFFQDCKIFFKWLIKCIRGDGNEYLGKTRDGSYALALLHEQRITQADYDEAILEDK